MSSFITQCPNCETSFNITQAQLKLAKENVRCGFCLQTFSAPEQQLFFEDEVQAKEQSLDEPIIQNSDNNENKYDISEAHSDNNGKNEEPASDQVIETFPEVNIESATEEENIIGEESAIEHESTDESTIEEDSHYTQNPHKTDATEEKESETSLPEYEQTDSGNTRNIEAGDEAKEPEDTLYIDEILEDKEVTSTEEPSEENIQIDRDEYLANKKEERLASVNDEEALNQNIENLPKESELKEYPEDNVKEESGMQESIEKQNDIKEIEDIDATIKDQALEIDTHSMAISPSGAIKRKDELQSLEALYDDEALNTDGSNPVNSISEEPIPIYRQNSRPAIVTAVLFSSNILLILALGAQYAWANFDSYLRDSRFSSLTGFICNYASCPEIERFDLSAFATDQLIVNSHSSISNALQIDFIFRNTAEFEQVFPLVEINFSDLNRRLVANRLFKPDEYLDGELQQFTHLPSNSSIQIRLEIADPGPEAINSSLSLRTP
jgi:predicted Zn finger-like uncharacterized protein